MAGTDWRLRPDKENREELIGQSLQLQIAGIGFQKWHNSRSIAQSRNLVALAISQVRAFDLLLAERELAPLEKV